MVLIRKSKPYACSVFTLPHAWKGTERPIASGRRRKRGDGQHSEPSESPDETNAAGGHRPKVATDSHPRLVNHQQVSGCPQQGERAFAAERSCPRQS
jgi:hypothetical protein